MKTKAALTIALLGAALGTTGAARADQLCMTVDEFNGYFAGGDTATTTVTLQFDVTGVNPADFANSKGCLSEFKDSRCTVDAGAIANVKVYGPYDPPNAAHPAGTIKFEYGTACCAAPPCAEGWANPNPSATAFVDGSEQCAVTVWLNPTDIGYHLDCTSGAFDAVGDNTEGQQVNQIALLSRNDGGWLIPNGVASGDQVCFEPPVVDPGGSTMTVPVLEDVAATMSTPSSVYQPVTDLSVEAGDSELFLKFDLSAVPGQVLAATLLLHLSDAPSSEGTGGDACALADLSWSENTLTWNTRPTCSSGTLSRVSPTTSYQWYSWDVSAAVSQPKIYGFAIVPEATDTNGSHFFSKEGSASLAPELRIEYGPGGAGGAGGQGGGSVGPPPEQGGGGATLGSPPDPQDPGASDDGVGKNPYGCACRTAPSGRPHGAPWLMLAAAGVGVVASARRRQRHRQP